MAVNLSKWVLETMKWNSEGMFFQVPLERIFIHDMSP